jgi:hypothetical protein
MGVSTRLPLGSPSRLGAGASGEAENTGRDMSGRVVPPAARTHALRQAGSRRSVSVVPLEVASEAGEER